MRIHQKIAKMFGYELLHRRKNPTLGAHITNLFDHYQIDLVLDVGANHGQFGAMLREEGYGGEIHSFEPVSSSYDKLIEAAKNDKNWFTHKLAMAEERGEKTINVTEASVLSSFLSPNEFGQRKFKNMGVVNREVVRVDTVDEFLSGKIIDDKNRRIFLKVDTQGYDLNVLKGARNSLTQLIGVLTEISLMPIYTETPHYLSVLKFYEENGFTVTGLFPVARDESSFALIDADCTLVNTRSNA